MKTDVESDVEAHVAPHHRKTKTNFIDLISSNFYLMLGLLLFLIAFIAPRIVYLAPFATQKWVNYFILPSAILFSGFGVKLLNVISSNINTPADNIVDVRESMRILPNWIQPILTWLTGKALNGEKPLFWRSNLSHIFTAYLCLWGGVTVSLLSFEQGIYSFIMPLGWLLTVSGARKIITTINHYAVHKDLIDEKYRQDYGKFQPLIADFNSCLLFLQNFAEYKDEHITHHDLGITATTLDPDMQFLWALGFRPGMSKMALWTTYIFNLLIPFSPLHVLFFKARIKTNLLKGTIVRRLIAAFFFVIPILFVTISSVGLVFWVWWFPMFFLYNMAALLQFSSEHIWLANTNDGLVSHLSKRELLVRSKRITVGRFCGSAAPNTENRNLFVSIILWTIWLFKMLFVHLPIRLFAVQGDLISHDLHHRGKFNLDWANAPYTRQEIMNSLKPGEEPFLEIWGLYNVIDFVFHNLSQMESIELTRVEIDCSDAVLGM